MIYLDSFGHLAADAPDELHAFAHRLGLRRRWYQEKGALSHFDVTSIGLRDRAVAMGARQVKTREMPAIVRRMNGGGGPA